MYPECWEPGNFETKLSIGPVLALLCDKDLLDGFIEQRNEFNVTCPNGFLGFRLHRTPPQKNFLDMTTMVCVDRRRINETKHMRQIY